MSKVAENVVSTLKKPLLCTEWTTVIPSEKGEFIWSPKFYLNSIQCQFRSRLTDDLYGLDVVRTDGLNFTECIKCTVVVGQVSLQLPPPSIRKVIDPQADYLWYIDWTESDVEFSRTRGEHISFFVVLEACEESAKEEEGCDGSENFKSLRSLSQDFAKLLDDSSNADIQLLCGDLTIPAHGNVLSARSDVFEKMLQTDMVEKRTGSIEIPDIQPEVIKEFLRYVYTGTLPEMSVKKASQLYEAGDKYNVRSLVEECASYVGNNLTEDYACDILAMADDHSDSELKERAICFILEYQIPLNPEHWKEFSDQRPKLALEVLQHAYENQRYD